MKSPKFPLVPAILLAILVVVPLLTLADTGGNYGGNNTVGGNNVTNNQGGNVQGIDVPNFLGGDCSDASCLLVRILNALWVLAALATVGMVLVAGFQFLFAAGNPEKISQARRTLTYAAIGFAVVILSFSAAALIQSTLGLVTGSGS